MHASTTKNLATVVRSFSRFYSIRSKIKVEGAGAGAAVAASKKKKKKKPASSTTTEDASLKQYVSAINSTTITSSVAAINSSLYDVVRESVKLGSKPGDDESGKQLSSEVSTLLHDRLDLDWDDEFEDVQPLGKVLNLPWLSRMSNNDISLRRKKVSRERKQKWVYKNTQTSRFDRLVKMCAVKLGTDATLELFGRLGRETGLKEYNSLIGHCIQRARDANDEEVSLEEIYKGCQLFKTMKELGFKIEEATYGQFLMYLIDLGMVQEFFFFRDLIKDENPDSLLRLAYYEMRLWIGVKNEAKIRELICSITDESAEDKYSFRENLLLALCESDRKEDILLLLEAFDITKVTSVECKVSIFKSLGKLSLESIVVDFMRTLKSSDIGPENMSKFICEYAISIPNLGVEEIIDNFKSLHTKLDVLPTSAQYEKLIRYSCELHKVHQALYMVDEMFEAGLTLSLDTVHSILEACEQSCDYNLVHQIKTMIYRHDLKPNIETCRLMIILFVKLKDFQGAYEVMNDLAKMNLAPTVNIFNAIMIGYLREKNICSGRHVLKQMEEADVKPDSATFSYLISSSNCEEDIIKFYNEMCNSGVQPTKFVFMALINAYAACGQFEKAKQVLLDKRIPVKSLNEIKSVLVSALASHGQLSEAFEMYEGIKEAGSNLQPKAIGCLIEHLKSEGELDRLLQLLEELNDSQYWVDTCFKVISYCIQHEHLRSIVDLLKQLKNNFDNAELATDALFDEVFSLNAEKEATDMQFGLSLLKAIKTELGVRPSRKSLDFLLSACVNAKDTQTSFLIWKEYEKAGLPYNILSYLRMYQALLASGDQKSAANMLSKIPRDDPHVCCVIKACQQTYKSAFIKSERKKKLKAPMKVLGDLFSEAGK
ncbi:pentatricopeptide repeat-containing protein At4g04790, mitochondrial-like isoform X1 [Olea europaea var. sylvestris]|uniref:pentatricopeptide repeat-containing protein At4g04790, mitochondrial-like isoform X1 n=2 Tax=Olea europaea var. sylvestris TaxID=158386 RepID=UPI000C1CD182|nr:pentatricopeptide repeat-containing protein At4g04790, mitochondrial-like isoform X1 [Olea europaea var. sylvestris]XP_022877505.1 pentatricopeptide repeat-containing protein At4g04790, mitochondrial-like isoform X1 [Olea europaea var. sylvestris]